MSKTISYRGKVPIGEQNRIRLKTINGKVGYKITKFQVINSAPGTIDSQTIAKIFITDQSASVSPTIDFSDSDLLACVYQKTGNSGGDPINNVTIFDNEPFNQDIFITVDDAIGNTTPINYYIELETMALSDLEATKLTLQNLRDIASQ
tara:strand:+ start:1251 stop:1697 length:447 start_codon:yes stop_codon:yes gene_type:complete